MAVAKKPAQKPPKKERIAAHIEELKRNIRARFPEAQFEVGPVPESRWPGLWVRCSAELISDVTDPLQEMRWEFFLRENMDVHVLVLDLKDHA